MNPYQTIFKIFVTIVEFNMDQLLLTLHNRNIISECKNPTLLETARSVLHPAQKPLKFWAESVSTACYVRNRSSTIFLKNVTPYEHWHGKKLDVSNVKVLGCKDFQMLNVKASSTENRFRVPLLGILQMTMDSNSTTHNSNSKNARPS